MLCDAHPQVSAIKKVCKRQEVVLDIVKRHLLTDDDTVSACSASLVVSVILGLG